MSVTFDANTQGHSVESSLINVPASSELDKELADKIEQLSKIHLSHQGASSSCRIFKCIKHFFSAIASIITQIYRKIFSVYTYAIQNDDNGKKILLGFSQQQGCGGQDIALQDVEINSGEEALTDKEGENVQMPKIFAQDLPRMIEDSVPLKINKTTVFIDSVQSISDAVDLLKSTFGKTAATAVARFLCQTGVGDLSVLINDKFGYKPIDNSNENSKYILKCIKNFDFEIKIKNDDVRIKITTVFRKKRVCDESLFGHSIKGITKYKVPLKTLELLGEFDTSKQHKIPLDTVDLKTSYKIITKEKPS